MQAFSRLESFLESVVERSFAGLFHARLQPVEIVKRLVRELENERVIGVSSVIVPNAYEVAVNRQDYTAFAPIKTSLEHDMCDYLGRYVSDHRYTLTADPAVTLILDETLQARQLVVRCAFTERPDVPRPELERLDPTILMPRVERGPVLAVPTPGGAYLDLSGERYSLSGPSISVGRGLENHIVLEDSRISRRHAVLLAQDGHWTVRDEGSTNGTLVNGRMVSQHALKHGDRVSFGGLELTFIQDWHAT